jgi:hypothetical protein
MTMLQPTSQTFHAFVARIPGVIFHPFISLRIARGIISWFDAYRRENQSRYFIISASVLSRPILPVSMERSYCLISVQSLPVNVW